MYHNCAPKIVDERLSGDLPLVLVGSIDGRAGVGPGALSVGRLVEWIPPHVIFAIVTGIGFLGNLWAAYANGAPCWLPRNRDRRIYGQVTVNDMIMARYTATPARARHAVRYFLLHSAARPSA